MKKIVILITILTLLGCTKQEKPIKENYLSSINKTVEIYDENYNKIKELPRGTKIQ